MIKTDKSLKIPNWSRNHVNRWTDYIEFRCLYTEDHFISKDDILDVSFDDNVEELQRGEIDHSEKYDKLYADIGNYFEMICYRDLMNRDYYPFVVEDRQCISLKSQLTPKHMQYIFLLFCSNICFMDRVTMEKITRVFEKYCCYFMRILMPADAQTELFGTSRDNFMFYGNLRSRIEKLADCLGAQTTKTLDQDGKYDRINAGDAGVDLVSFLKLDDASHIPFAFGQCTCSYGEWINKQSSIYYDTWRARLDPIAAFWQYMYVPFFCHNALGRLEQASDIHTCLIDRQRILNLLKLHENVLDEIASLKIKELLIEIW